MALNIGILCSGDGPELATVIFAVESGRLPADIKVVIADRDSAALTVARSSGLYSAFIPRSAYHTNRDGFERRLVTIFEEAKVEVAVLVGYERELGPVLTTAFPNRLFGSGLMGEQLVTNLAQRLRGELLTLVRN
ncbi:MAG: hypothetical protein AMR96_04905 [Candidatus Adiutrix intracellularis]|jgi:phosphoribosylglycinamide formyltransferase-1|nr:MAG: hypothetical protein AMR96_04905 [Candidatus Adiutrix intracellularis]MDR2826542.1 hypothetical protein [Candidatus Adiutrix intracellularis]